MTRIFRFFMVAAIVCGGIAVAPSAVAEACPIDAHEDDDTIAQANELDAAAPIVAQSCAGDPDVFRIFLPEHSQYTLTVTPAPGFDVALERLEESGSPIQHIDNGQEGEIEQTVSGFTVDLWLYYRVIGVVIETPDEGAYSIAVTGFAKPLSIAALDTAVTDNLNTLDPAAESSELPSGWRFREVGNNSDPRANFLYMPDDGSDEEADTYSYGTATDSDRAFGTLGEGSGLHPLLEVFLRNDTGSTIGSLDVSFMVEQWRLGDVGGLDGSDFGYRPAFGSFADVDALDLTTPNNVGPTGALDGNAASNRSPRTSTMTGLEIPAGGYFFFQWADADTPGNEDGLAIDDLSITAAAVPPPPPDADEDGVTDASDLCPNTPKGEGADGNGCGPSQLDTDGDGVDDATDACPATPSGQAVGANGCSWTLVVTKTGQGKVTSSGVAPVILCGTDCSETLAHGDEVSLTPKPKRGYRFKGWTGDCIGRANPCDVTMEGDKAVTAVFKRR